MGTIEGIVTIVQEGRFQLTDDDGVSHLLILAPGAGAETGQLTPLQHRQARVRVRYDHARDVIGLVARSIALADPRRAA